jgi:hypothetical protein
MRGHGSLSVVELDSTVESHIARYTEMLSKPHYVKNFFGIRTRTGKRKKHKDGLSKSRIQAHAAPPRGVCRLFRKERGRDWLLRDMLDDRKALIPKKYFDSREVCKRYDNESRRLAWTRFVKFMNLSYPTHGVSFDHLLAGAVCVVCGIHDRIAAQYRRDIKKRGTTGELFTSTHP